MKTIQWAYRAWALSISAGVEKGEALAIVLLLKITIAKIAFLEEFDVPVGSSLICCNGLAPEVSTDLVDGPILVVHVAGRVRDAETAETLRPGLIRF